jgi:hypothetical protein
MKLILALILSLNAHAALPPTTLQGQGGTKGTVFNFQVPNKQATKTGGVNALIETGSNNLLHNPGFEHQTYSTDWTLQGAGSYSAETSAVFSGLRSIRLTTSSNSGNFFQDSTAYAAQLGGTQGVVAIRCNNTAATAQLCPRVNGVRSASCASMATTGQWVEYSVPFVFGSTSSGIEVVVTSSTGVTICDDAYLGVPRAGDISEAAVVGPWVDYGPMTIGAVTTAPTKGTTTTDNVACRIVGEDYHCRWQFKQTTNGTAGSGNYLFTLPSGIEFSDRVRLYTGTSFVNALADSWALGNGQIHSGGANGEVQAIPYSATQFRIVGKNLYSTSSFLGSAYYQLNQQLDIYIEFWFPGKGLRSNVTSISQRCADPRQCENVFVATIDGSVSPSTVSGENLDWINGNCTRPSNGNFSCPVPAGIFTSVPTCLGYGNNQTVNRLVNQLSSSTVTNLDFSLRSGGDGLINESFRIVCTRSTDSNIRRQITATVQDVPVVPGFSGRPKECKLWFGQSGSTLAAPLECTSSPCAVFFDSCNLGVTSVVRTGAGLYTPDFPAGTFANNSPVECRCVAYDNTTNDRRFCSTVFLTGRSTVSSTSNGGYLAYVRTEDGGATSSNTYVQLSCTGVAP